MDYRKLLQRVIGRMLVALLLVGCSAPVATPTPVVIVVTATPQATPTPVLPTSTPTLPTPTAEPPMPTDTPEEAAREWLGALLNLDGNTLSKRTCDAQQEEIQSGAIWLSAIAAFGEMLTGQREQADISDLQFVTTSKSGDIAQVRVTGEIRTAVLAIAQTQQVDETWQMVREGGRWEWCGYPEPPPTPTRHMAPDLAPIGYAYTLESGNDGWAYGQVKLAFQNITDHLAYNTHLSIEAYAYVETEEGQDYPALVYSDECPRRDYGHSLSSLELTEFAGFPPGFIARRAWLIGWFGTGRYVVCFRVAEITHPTRIVFPSLPEWTIDLAETTVADPGFPGDASIQQPIPISTLTGHILHEIPGQASMFLDGTCSVETDYYYVLHLNYTIENRDSFQGARFSGNLGEVSLESGAGTFMISHPLTYDIEVGPGQTVHEYFEIGTNTVVGDLTFPPGRPVLVVLYGRLSNESRGYSVVSLDSCLSQ